MKYFKKRMTLVDRAKMLEGVMKLFQDKKYFSSIDHIAMDIKNKLGKV